MTKTLTVILFTGLSILLPFPAASQPVGKVYITSNCASGGFDYYFFERQTVISVCSGCEALPYIQYGSYEINDHLLVVKMEEEWYGEGAGAVVAAYSVNLYERYVAKYALTNESFTIPLAYFYGESTESCEEVKPHSYTVSNPHIFLRNDFVGKFPETFQRLLTDDDLKDKTKQDLRLMRNEIFARYGYIFSSADLKQYFQKQSGYREFGKDVEAFLSDIEKANVDLIKQYEQLTNGN